MTGISITIRRVYYVLSLGANLLLYKRLYTLRLIRAFNTKVLRLLKSLLFICVLKAYQSKGIYIIEWITDQLPTYIIRDIKSYFSTEAAFYIKKGYINRTTAKEQVAISDREKRYILIYRRFGYIRKDTIRNFY